MIDPNRSQPSEEEILHQLYNNAVLLRDRGEHAKALTVIETVLQAVPGWELALQIKGELLSDLGCEEDALSVYRTLLRLNPHAQKIRERFVDLLARQRARRLLETPNGKTPYVQSLVKRLAPTLEQSGSEVAQEVPKSVSTAYARTFLDEAQSMAAQGQIEEALALAQLALRLAPELTEARYLLGTWYEKLGLLKQALKSYQQAVKEAPDNAAAQARLEAVRQLLSAQPWVTIARYARLSEAEVARARLEVEGITAQVTNRALANYLGAIVLADPFQLKVPQSEAAIACDVLGIEPEDESPD